MKFLLILLIAMLSSCDKNTNGQAHETEIIQRTELSLKDALAEKKLKSGSPVFIRAFKEQKILELFIKSEISGTFELFREYPIVAASGELGPKLAEGDGQVPEGFYHVGPRAMNPNSRYHLSFNIGYPNEYDSAHNRTGSFIMIHGGHGSIGCLAMTDEKIEEIYSLCHAGHKGGQTFFRVHIFPFRMTDMRMQEANKDKHYAFWKNLKTGYDYFEEKRLPPNSKVRNKIYTFK